MTFSTIVNCSDMRNFNIKIPLLLLLSALLLPLAASAVTLDEAKGSGLVGETWKGYLAAVEASPSAEVEQLVDEVNAKRRTEYERIAKKNGIKVEDVEKVAGKKAIEKTAAGQLVKDESGAWQTK